MSLNSDKLAKNYNKFYRYAKKVARKAPRVDPQDLLHNLCLRFLQSNQDFESGDGYFYENLKGCLFNIVISKDYNTASLENLLEIGYEPILTKTDAQMFAIKLKKLLKNRKNLKTQLKILELYLNDNNFKEIGEILNMKYDTVKANFRHIVTKARKELKHESKSF
jgi:DNA-directed RNA polymerase specialized sigma24 family protein